MANINRFKHFSNSLTEKKSTKNKKKESKDKKTSFISKKIRKLMEEGYPHNQAVAIAMSYAEKKGLLESVNNTDTLTLDKKTIIDLLYKFMSFDKNIEKDILDKIESKLKVNIEHKKDIKSYLNKLDMSTLEIYLLNISK